MTERDRMDPRLAASLEDVFAKQIVQDTSRSVRPPAQRLDAHRRRTVWVTAAVGVLVVLLTVATIRTVNGRQHVGLPAATPSSPSPAATSVMLLSLLPRQPYGTVVHTWTDRDATASGPFDVAGSTIVIAGICEGGGKISWTDVTARAHTMNCGERTVQQPDWRFDLGGDGLPTTQTGPTSLSVRVLEGAPRFIVRAWKVDPRILNDDWSVATTSSAVPKTLRTCTAGDLDAAGTFRRLSDLQGGVVTITNRSSSDCAIRSWPAMSYLDRTGHQIGATQGGTDDNGKSLDSREGTLNRYKEFPPARLAAGGHGYLIAELFTRTRLDRDDRDSRSRVAHPTPSPTSTPPQVQLCHSVAVASLRIAISGSVVTVPVPGAPTTAACSNDAFSFGVNPVVATDPTTR